MHSVSALTTLFSQKKLCSRLCPFAWEINGSPRLAPSALNWMRFSGVLSDHGRFPFCDLPIVCWIVLLWYHGKKPLVNVFDRLFPFLCFQKLDCFYANNRWYIKSRVSKRDKPYKQRNCAFWRSLPFLSTAPGKSRDFDTKSRLFPMKFMPNGKSEIIGLWNILRMWNILRIWRHKFYFIFAKQKFHNYWIISYCLQYFIECVKLNIEP